MMPDMPGRSSSASPGTIFEPHTHPAPASASPFPKRFFTRSHSYPRWLWWRDTTSHPFSQYCKQTEPHTHCAHHRLTPLPRFVEWCFLTLVGWSYKDVVCAFFFTFLLGGFACLMWSNVKRLQCKLDDIFGRIEALHQAINVGIISPPARTSRLTNYISLSNRTLLSDPPLNTSPCMPSRTFVFFREKSPHCNQS